MTHRAEKPDRSTDRSLRMHLLLGLSTLALLAGGVGGWAATTELSGTVVAREPWCLKRPLSGEWPYLWLDATDLKVREGGRIVSVAAIIAVAVDSEGKREIVGLHIGPSEAEPFWSTFLRDLVRRGLKGVKLVISDAHEGLKAAIIRIIGATWQRCRVHFMRNALAHVPKGQTTVVAAAIRQVFLQPDHPQPPRPGATSPTSSAPAGLSSAPAWTPPSTTCSPN
jgi:Transposase, Mutator family